ARPLQASGPQGVPAGCSPAVPKHPQALNTELLGSNGHWSSISGVPSSSPSVSGAIHPARPRTHLCGFNGQPSSSSEQPSPSLSFGPPGKLSQSNGTGTTRESDCTSICRAKKLPRCWPEFGLRKSTLPLG